MTPEGIADLRIGDIPRPTEREAQHGMMTNCVYDISWSWDKLSTISDEDEQPHRIRLTPEHLVWKDRVFRIPKKMIPFEKEQVEAKVK